MLYYRVAFCVSQENIQTTYTHQDDNHYTTSANENARERENTSSAVQVEEPETEHAVAIWKWRSTLLTSPHALFTLLRAYNYMPKEDIRVFFASTEDDMDEMLARQNQGLVSSSVTAEQFLAGQRMNELDVRRLELELNNIEGHDEAYVFTVPSAVKEYTTWIELMRKYTDGELES